MTTLDPLAAGYILGAVCGLFALAALAADLLERHVSEERRERFLRRVGLWHDSERPAPYDWAQETLAEIEALPEAPRVGGRR